jgi:hypothetical protein
MHPSRSQTRVLLGYRSDALAHRCGFGRGSRISWARTHQLSTLPLDRSRALLRCPLRDQGGASRRRWPGVSAAQPRKARPRRTPGQYSTAMYSRQVPCHPHSANSRAAARRGIVIDTALGSLPFSRCLQVCHRRAGWSLHSQVKAWAEPGSSFVAARRGLRRGRTSSSREEKERRLCALFHFKTA